VADWRVYTRIAPLVLLNVGAAAAKKKLPRDKPPPPKLEP